MKAVFMVGLGLIALFPAAGFGAWTQINPPRGGQLRAFASTGSSIFTVTANNNIPAVLLRSRDSGKTWTPPATGLPEFHWGGLAAIGNTLFMATEKSIFKSTDDGASWIEAKTGIPAKDSLDRSISIQVLAACDGILYAGGIGPLFVSRDSGQSWIKSVDFPVYSITASGAVVVAPGYIPMQGIALSLDCGQSWKTINPLSRLDPVDAYELAAAICQNAIFIPAFGKGIFRSADSGATWTDVSSGLGDLKVWALAVLGTSIFAGTESGGIFRSTDQGNHWIEVNTGLNERRIRTLSVLGSTVFAGTFESGAYVSSDSGETWAEYFDGFPPVMTSVLAAAGGTLFVGSEFGGIYASSDGGVSWKKPLSIEFDLGWPPRFLALDSNNILAAGRLGGMYRLRASPAGFTVTDSDTAVRALSMAKTGNTVFAISCNNAYGVVQSVDTGRTWTSRSTKEYPCAGSLAAGRDGVFAAYFDIYRSTDSGATWQKTNSPTTLTLNLVAASGGTVFAAGEYGGLYRSTDGGSTWGASGVEIFSMPVNCFQTARETVFLGTDGNGVFYSFDDGGTWSAFNGGLADLSVSSLAQMGSTLYAATGDGNIWRRLIAETGVMAGTNTVRVRSPRVKLTGGRIVVTFPPDEWFREKAKLSVHRLDGSLIAKVDIGPAAAKGTNLTCQLPARLASGTYYYRFFGPHFATLVNTGRFTVVEQGY
jgi:photosystem II stability/assembly factor-like uncharacterized protein